MRHAQRNVLLASAFALALAAGDARGGEPPQPLLVKLRVPFTDDVVSALSAGVRQVSYVWPQIRAMAVTASAAQADALRADPKVAYVELDRAFPAGGLDGTAEWSATADEAP